MMPPLHAMLLALKMEEGEHEARNASDLYELKMQGNRFSPRFWTGLPACQHLDFNPVKLIPNF